MTYGATLYWHSWDTACAEPDYVITPGVESATVFDPPELLTHFLERKVNMPCMGSMLMRRVLHQPSAPGKTTFAGSSRTRSSLRSFASRPVCSRPTIAWTKYRQHRDSACFIGIRTGQLGDARTGFHAWLGRFLQRQGLEGSHTWNAFRDEVARSSVAIA